MRHGLAMLLLSILFLIAGATPAQGPPRASAAKMQETLQQLLLDVREAKGLAGGITDKNLRSRMEQTIARMEQRCIELQKQIAAAPTAPAVRRPVADPDLARFVNAVKAEAFDDGKGVLVRDYAKNNYFTSKQAASLVKLFSFGDGQRKAAVAVYPRLVDPGNFFEVLQVFTFDSDRDKVRKELGIK